MPNWVFNGLEIAGSKQDVANIRFQLNQPFEREHDQWNMETGEMEYSIVTKYDNPIFAFWNIVRPVDLEAYYKQPSPDTPMEERLLFQGNDWYSWNVRNWGTKWDVAIHNDDEYPETTIEIDITDDETMENDLLCYRFNTAWSPPEPVIAELARQYPNTTITLSYEEETGWGGVIEFKGDETKTVEEYDNKCPDCDEINSIDWDEETGEHVCTKCDYRS